MAKTDVFITYIACMGVLIRDDEKSILIDAIITPGIRPYPSITKEVLVNMIKKAPPFNKIDYILITHEHEEHFNPDFVCQVLSACPEARLIAPKTVIARIRGSRYFKKRFIMQMIGLDIAPNKMVDFTLGKFQMFFIHLPHEADMHDIQNIAFLIQLGHYRLLFTGDSATNIEVFQQAGLTQKSIDCIIAPFTFVITESGVHTMDILQPRYLIAIHFPLPQYDVNKRYQNALDIINNPLSPLPRNTFLLTESMKTVIIR
mgnify:CR=1 FL=1|jgi:L-ascorbate metabolism protein UlaG (beta-lactamase superfamily)